jgi:hypothetical protein
MEFIKLYHVFYVEPLMWVPELIILVDFYREEKSDKLFILIVDQALLPICMVDEPFQNLYARENRVSFCHHV